jgi:hypothetical protein
MKPGRQSLVVGIEDKDILSQRHGGAKMNENEIGKITVD